MALVREEALKTITDGLSWVAAECKLRGLLHLFDSNTISHELFCRLLNEVYDLSLMHTDRIKVNFPAIDLGDDVNKRCFQITTEKDGAKVQNTLDTFAEHRLGEQYGRLQVLVIGEKQRGYKSVKVPPAVTFDPDADVLDLGDLLKLIEALSTEKLTRLAEIVRAEVKTTPVLGAPIQRTFRVQLVPADPVATSQMDLTQEIRDVKERLRKSDARDVVDIVSSWSDSFDGFQEWLFSIQPRVLHFVGRETGSEFTLRPGQGEHVAVPDGVVRSFFSHLRGKVRLVILERALSESQAVAIREESECTITIPPGASRGASTAYLTALYRGMGYGQSIRAAHDQAISAIQVDGHPTHTAFLVVRAGVDPNAILLAAPPPPRGAADAGSKIQFVQLEMATDQCLWEEMRHHRAPEAPIHNPLTGRPWFNQVYEVQPKETYPFGSHQLANYYWAESHRESEARVADPILEFTIVNRGPGSAVVSRIGFRVANAWNAAKAAPLAFKIVSYDAYELAVRDFVIGDDQLLRLPDPIYLEQNASYRFRLRLKDYARGAKVNETVIRLLVIANTDTFLSDEIYLGIMWTGDSFTSQPNATERPSAD